MENIEALSNRSGKWSRGLEGKRVDGLFRTKEKIYDDIIKHGETLISSITLKEYPKLDVKSASRVLERTFAAYLLTANKLLPSEMWCALYKKYRGVQDAYFEKAKGSDWDALDKLFKAQCKEKTEKKPGDQASAFDDCKEGESIYVCAEQQPLRFELVGNGKNTREAALIVTNEKTGAWGIAVLSTVCASNRKMLPPPPRNIGQEKGLTYRLGKADPKHVAAVKAAFRLQEQGKLVGKPINNPHELAQLAIWRREGEKTPDASDDIDRNYFKEKLEKQLGRPFTPQEELAAAESISTAFAQLDFDKEGSELIAEKPDQAKPESPDTSTPPDKPQDGEGPEDTPPKPDAGKPPEQAAGGKDCTLVCVPAGTTFIPSDPFHQIMTAILSATLELIQGPVVAEPADESPGILIGTGGATQPEVDGTVCTPFDLTSVSKVTFNQGSARSSNRALLSVTESPGAKFVVIKCHCQKGSAGQQFTVTYTETINGQKKINKITVNCK